MSEPNYDAALEYEMDAMIAGNHPEYTTRKEHQHTLEPQGVEALVAKMRKQATAVYLAAPEEVARDVSASLIAAASALAHHPTPVPPVTAEDSVPSAADVAYREGVMTERDQWRKATGVGHWRDYHRPALTTPPALSREQEDAVIRRRLNEQWSAGRLRPLDFWDIYLALAVAPETREEA